MAVIILIVDYLNGERVVGSVHSCDLIQGFSFLYQLICASPRASEYQMISMAGVC
jgi:hypothetical protein